MKIQFFCFWFLHHLDQLKLGWKKQVEYAAVWPFSLFQTSPRLEWRQADKVNWEVARQPKATTSPIPHSLPFHKASASDLRRAEGLPPPLLKRICSIGRHHVCMYVCYVIPSRQNHAESAENPQGFWLLVEEIHAETWVVSEIRIDAEIQGIFFKSSLKWAGSYPKLVNLFNSPTKNDMKSIQGYCHTIGTLSSYLYCILKFWGK